MIDIDKAPAISLVGPQASVEHADWDNGDVDYFEGKVVAPIDSLPDYAPIY